MLIGTEPLLHYAGLFAMRPRSAERLGAMVSDWLGMRVEVIEFAGAWLTLPPDQRTRIGAYGQFSQLSVERGGRSARLGSAGPGHPAHRTAGPCGVRTPAAGSAARCNASCRWCGPMSGSRSGSPSIRCCAADACRRCGSTRARTQNPGWAGTRGWSRSPAGDDGATDAADPVFEAEIIEAQQPAGSREGTRGMSGWGGGYVTDVTYTVGWYRQQSPAMMALAVDHRRRPRPRSRPATIPCCCSNLAAASATARWPWRRATRAGRVTAVDFNPAHIASAREWAAEAGLTNITFIEADFVALGGQPSAACPAGDGLRHHARGLELDPAGRAEAGIVRLLSAEGPRPAGWCM